MEKLITLDTYDQLTLDFYTHTLYIHIYIYIYKIYPINELQFSGSSELAEGVELIRRELLRRISIEVHIKVPKRG